MNFERFLTSVTHHSESIIQWVFLGILLLSGLLIFRSMFGKKTSAAAAPAAGVSPELQAALDKLLAQTAKLESVSLKEMSPAGVAEVEAQVQTLKADLAAREEEINKLKTSGSSQASEDAGKLSARIKELEAKLAEYEILEDDIADLSLYKEENTRLRAELEKAKGGAVAPAAAPASDVPPAAELPAEADLAAETASVPQPEAQSGEAIVAEFAQAVSTEPPQAAAPSDLSIPDTGNPMADFESTVELERKLTAAAPEEKVASPGAAAVAPAEPAAPNPEAPADASAPFAAQAEADDLFAEFSQPSGTADGEASTLDTDKMMQEMAALVSMEPSQGNALEESIDIEKMAMEAKKS